MLYRESSPGILATTCDFKTVNYLLIAIGQIVAAQGIVRGQSSRKIILCRKENGPFWLIDLYKQAGFEFMTPDELIAMLESESQSKTGGQSA